MNVGGLLPAQRLALDLERNVAVVAGAGCGKTQILAARFLWTLRAGGVRESEILALTFTEKAAAEMKARVRRSLAADGRDAEHLRISTIHAFCAALLREHALAAQVDPGFAIVEGAERIVLLRQVIDGLLSRLASAPAHEDDAHALRTMARLYGRSALAWLLRRLVVERDRVERWAEATWDRSDAALLSRWRAAAPGGLALARRLTAGREFAAALAGLRARRRVAGRRCAQAVADVERALAEIAGGQARGLELLLDALFQRGGARRSFSSDDAGPALYAVQSLVEPYAADLRAEIGALDGELLPYLRALARLFRAALGAYDAAKAERQLLDFDDLAVRAAALLAQRAAARTEVRAQVRHLLVDEVQDVSESQWDLIRWLVTQDEAGQVLRPACLFAVGDEKQSIYRFRGAEVTVFARLCAKVEQSNAQVTAPPRVPDGAGELPPAPSGIVALGDNYRSHPVLLAFTNQLFEGLLAGASEPWEARPQALRPCRSQQPPESELPEPGVDLLLHVDPPPALEEDGAEESNGGGDDLALYGEADRVARYLQSGRWRAPGAPGPPPWRACAILLPMRTHLRSYEDALRRYGVPFVVLGGVGFFRTTEVVDVVCLLEFLADERRDIELAGLLRSPLGALPDGLLYAIARAPGATLWAKLAAAAGGRGELCAAASGKEQAQLREVAARIGSWRKLAARLPASEVVARALDQSGAWAGLAQGLRGPQRLANVAKLLDWMRDHEAGGFRALADVATTLRVMMQDEEREGEAAVDAVGADAVRILTIHAAKGLEFPLVLVPELGARFLDGTDRVLIERLAADAPPELAFKVPDPASEGRLAAPGLLRLLRGCERKKTDAEMKRLLYVACTRARERLVLSGSARQGRDGAVRVPQRSWLAGLVQHLGLDLDELARTGQGGPGALGAAAYQVVWGRTLPAQPVPVATGARPALAPAEEAAALAAAQPLGKERLHLRLTPTVARDLERCVHKVRLRILYGVPEFRETEPGEEAWDEEQVPEPLERGRLLHRAFELGAFAAPDPAAVVRRLAVQARIGDAALVGAVVAQVSAFAQSPLGHKVAALQPAWAELPFLMREGEIEVSGKIDRLARDGAGWLLLDWKTDKVGPDAVTAHARAAGYFTQMQLYLLAARALVGDSGPVRGLLYFTEPGVAVEVPAGPSPLSGLHARALLDGALPAPAASVCEQCGYHARRLCPADRLR